MTKINLRQLTQEYGTDVTASTEAERFRRQTQPARVGPMSSAEYSQIVRSLIERLPAQHPTAIYLNQLAVSRGYIPRKEGPWLSKQAEDEWVVSPFIKNRATILRAGFKIVSPALYVDQLWRFLHYVDAVVKLSGGRPLPETTQVFKAFYLNIPARDVVRLGPELKQVIRQEPKTFAPEKTRLVRPPRRAVKRVGQKAVGSQKLKEYQSSELALECEVSPHMRLNSNLLRILSKMERPLAKVAIDWICKNVAPARHPEMVRPQDVDWQALGKATKHINPKTMWTYVEDNAQRRIFYGEPYTSGKVNIYDLCGAFTHFVRPRYPHYADFFDELCRRTNEQDARKWLRAVVHDNFEGTLWGQLTKKERTAFLSQRATSRLPGFTQPGIETDARTWLFYHYGLYQKLGFFLRVDFPITRWLASLGKPQIEALNKTRKAEIPPEERYRYGNQHFLEFRYVDKIDELIEQDLSTSVTTTFENLMERQKRQYREKTVAQTEIVSYPPSLNPKYKYARWLVRKSELVHEGSKEQMHHCVGLPPYPERLASGGCYILSIHSPHDRSTAEIVPGTFKVAQHFGYNNSPPSPSHRKYLSLILDDLKNRKG